MARGSSSGGGRRGASRPRESVAEGALRLHMHEFEANVKLVPGGEPPTVRGRKGPPTIYDAQAPTPKGMSEVFPRELTAMRRLGRPTDKAYTVELAPYRVYCLRYYDYDGLCALLYVEKGGNLVAAWSAREVERALAARSVWVADGEADLQAFLRHAMLTFIQS